ncbi:hypothetical protein [Maribacter halichondriae]|uniref:hypothetical protein n=1 Tax=Maribacter halichondriae TaxID=2980554 RepID=UPI00235A033B|nr:hypothetical protein [Maribacter sp. Hal144]
MRTLTYLAFLLFLSSVNAQVVDQSINGVQTGFLGIWLNNESRIAPNWAFRSEIGLEATLLTGLTDGEVEYPVFVPIVSFEPRWYYNSPKRQGNTKNTFHNSSNYLTVAIRWYPEFWAISPHTIDEIDGAVFIVPTWGIRRNISFRWNYEVGIGMGVDVYELLFSEVNTTDVNFNLHVRIGYKFGKL